MHDENENKDDINKLKERGLSLLADKVKDGRYQKQVIELWENGLPYESVPYDHKDYLYDNSELWVIVDEDTETVASAIWWNDRNGIREARHIVTNPLYYGSGLAKILNHYMYYNAIKNEIIEIQSWVAEDNYKSRKMHEGLGWSYSNVSIVNFISQALNEKNNSR